MPFSKLDYIAWNDQINEGDVINSGENAWIDIAPIFPEKDLSMVDIDLETIAVLDTVESETRHYLPEKNLLAALMVLSVADVSRQIKPQTEIKYDIIEIMQNAKAAYKWFESDDISYPFSFKNVCENLNLCAFTVRLVVRRLYSTYVRTTLAHDLYE